MWKLIKRIIYTLIILGILGVLWGRFFNPPITITQINDYFKYGKLDRDYVPYDQISNNVKRAVIASEDQRFYIHHGFDFEAIQKAMIHNENPDKKTLMGASTISQQTARNVFLWQGRSWLRKGIETIFTFVIERVWNKDIILDRYLNTIEMGQGVFGVEAASKYYFNTSAKDLTVSQAAWIAAVLPNPKVYDPKHPSRRLLRKHAWIMRQMRTVRLQ